MSTLVPSCAGAASHVVIAVSGVPAAGPIWWIGVSCGTGRLLGGYLGARLQERLPQRALTGILGLLAVAVARAYLGRAFLS